VSVCGGKYEVPMFVEANVLLNAEDMTCGAVVYVNTENGGLRYLYGFISYKDVVAENRMQTTQLMIARFIDDVSTHNAGEFKEGQPDFSVVPDKNINILLRDFEQTYNDARFSGRYEIYTKVEGNATNSYFIGYSHLEGRLQFYDKFKEWALKR
jgi:hypothetical protein